MISFEQAMQAVCAAVPELSTQRLLCADASGYVLAEAHEAGTLLPCNAIEFSRWQSAT